MLKSLTVSNFALIEQASIEFTCGLNILTGETGAGKSILIDAFSAVLGNRTSVDFIRSGCDYYRLEAVFDISDNKTVQQILEGYDIALEQDGTLIISRKLSRHGKNTILINGCHTPLNMLKEIGTLLVDIHGQHENQALLRPESHIILLDNFDTKTKSIIREYKEVFERWRTAMKEMNSFQKNAREIAQRLDMLTWQTKEIAACSLRVGEDEEIEQKIKVLSNAEKITRSVHNAYKLLNEHQLSTVKRELEIVVKYDSSLQEQLKIVTDALYALEDVSGDLRNYIDSCEFNPQILSALQERMDNIYKLKKKYGPTVEDILTYYNNAVKEQTSINNQDEVIESLTKECRQLEEKLVLLSDKLTQMRKRSAKTMEQEITGHLNDLAMPRAKLEIQVLNTQTYQINGCNQVNLLFSANVGEEPKSLHKIASGGELSRIALAIKTVASFGEQVQTMVFDEVDAGVGGKTAQKVAEKIAFVALSKQVLCITHLPQIACMADAHIYIEKAVKDDHTYTNIKLLNPEEHLYEITRMIAGENITKLALENAAQMIEFSKQKKEIWKNKAQA